MVEKYIESTGKCPITGEPLDASDLLPLKSGGAVKPRPVAAASIPGMLSLFQNEWDALMLEMFTQKQQLESVRQELGHALYQHDAACRVIARLITERDDARKALAEAKPSAAAAGGGGAAAPMEVEGGKPAAGAGMTAEITAKFDATSKALSKGRKKRAPPAGQLGADAIAAFAATASTAMHGAGAACVDVHATEPLAATGGADGAVRCYDAAKRKAAKKSAGHTGAVSRVRLHATQPLIVSASADSTVRVWSREGKSLHTIAAHSDAVADVTLHATGDYCVSASADKSWALSDLTRGEVILSVGDAPSGYSCAGFHPDGLILGTGTESLVRIWDVKSQANVASFEGHTGAVSGLAFSENGYYLATGSADATVRLWDLRKLKNFQTITPSAGAAVGAVGFDFSGQFLAVGAGPSLTVYETKSWGTVAELAALAAPVSGVGFASGATFLAAASADGKLTLYGQK